MASKIDLSPPVAFAADRSKAVVLVLFLHCYLLFYCSFVLYNCMVFSNGLVTPFGEERADFSVCKTRVTVLSL